MILAGINIDTNAILGIFSLVGFVLGFLTQNPYTKKWVPKWISETMEKLPPAKVDELVSKYGTTEARTETAKEMLQVELAEHGINIDATQSGQVIDYLGQRYRETIGKLLKR